MSDFKNHIDFLSEALDHYLKQSQNAEIPVLAQPPMQEIIDKLDLNHLIKKGGLEGKTFEKFTISYLEHTTKLHHPGYLAHQVCAPHPTGALGSLIDGFTNNAMAINEMGPAASAIEYSMVNWMLTKIGWKVQPVPPAHDTSGNYGGGLFTHGGSLANLTALLGARSAVVPEFWAEGNPGNLIILCPEQSHYSIKRSAAILGIGENNVITLPADKDGRVEAAKIPDLVRNLKSSGKKIMALVANACGTAAGLYDDLDEIGRYCNDNDIWFHVDGAHGAGALLTEKLRPLMRGIEKADSMIWDAHKMLRTPILCAAVLFKRHKDSLGAFSQEASYLFHEKEQPGYDIMAQSVECTKSGLGLKFFMTLAAYGEAGMAEYIDGRVDLARASATLIENLPHYSIPIMPETNILCFRIGEDDDMQLKIRVKLLQAGNFYISTTLYKNKRWLRLVFLNPTTTLEDIKRLTDEISIIHNNLLQNSSIHNEELG